MFARIFRITTFVKFLLIVRISRLNVEIVYLVDQKLLLIT